MSLRATVTQLNNCSVPAPSARFLSLHTNTVATVGVCRRFCSTVSFHQLPSQRLETLAVFPG